MIPDLLVTLWPSFPHFNDFAYDHRLSGIRLNSAMISGSELDHELKLLENYRNSVPLYFDIKGRQMRVEEVIPDKKNLICTLNHPIDVKTPCVVLFKAGEDVALLDHLEDDGKKLVFRGGPEFNVLPGESLHIRDSSLKVKGDIFTTYEREKIEKVRKFGFKKYFLSYVEKQSDVDQFQELVGKDSEIWLKIESLAGMNYVVREFKKQDNLVLVAARGDMFVELELPHDIIKAQRIIINRDPEACVGSRILLSALNGPIPSCADLTEIAWLHDIGYHKMMLCDELCLKKDLLDRAVDVFCGIRGDL